MGLFTWDRYELLTIVLMYNMAVKSSRCYAFLLSYCDLEDIEKKKRFTVLPLHPRYLFFFLSWLSGVMIGFFSFFLSFFLILFWLS